VRNTVLLETVWIATEGGEAILWLCRMHLEGMRSADTGSRRILWSVGEVVTYPALREPRVGGH